MQARLPEKQLCVLQASLKPFSIKALDNIATVQIIENDRSKEPFIMTFMCAMLINFVPGSSSCMADALSRFKIQRFRELVPGAAIAPTSCPPMSEILWTSH
jgi:hypothetical protein